jgi:hypothetical protein
MDMNLLDCVQCCCNNTSTGLLIKDWISLFFSAVTSVGVVWAVLSFNQSKRASYFSTMQKCITEFRSIVRRIQEIRQEINNQELAPSALKDQQLRKIKYDIELERLKMDMLGLINEQLYYIENDYADEKIAVEWLITFYLLLTNNASEQDVDSDFFVIKEEDYKDTFDRVSVFKTQYLEKYLQNKDCIAKTREAAFVVVAKIYDEKYSTRFQRIKRWFKNRCVFRKDIDKYYRLRYRLLRKEFSNKRFK